ncbi:MAG: hypothetical protein GX444_17215 [Myxococcales bacterium]|nr:hypothetical protein [Myxococcales bacterium]
MSKPLRVAFLWHMHQPYYLDDTSGKIILPWVRLHATKAYYDMSAMLLRHPEMACTINAVPSLLAQLKAYAERPDIDDSFLALSRKPAAELDDEERRFVLRYFFMANWETLIRPYPGYSRLLDRRGIRTDEESLDRALKLFSNQDFLDLQVWFNLAWFGFTARRDPRIVPLLEKGMSFTEPDKRLLLDVQLEILKQIIPLWKKLLEAGRVEISTSPFYHPILPILVGSHVVRRSMPEVTLHGDFSFEEDARDQIREGVAYYESIFGQAARGMWPSEGSVCPEIIPHLADAGLEWIATDEAILFRSLGDGSSRQRLFEPYRAEYKGSQICVFFRDRYLSDLIGFTYAKNDPRTAILDFAGHLGRIAESAPDGLVNVVLDGENPWEYYRDGGEAFLDGLYQTLLQDKRFRPVSMGQALREAPPKQTLTKLHSGSWINANYRIWIGGPEENRAWSLVDRTRSHFETVRQAGNMPPEKIAAARRQLFQAEGSDWFWWYDDDFNSENDSDFDRLFRQKLVNVYLALDENPPAVLSEPIHVDKANLLITQPLALLHPTIDGHITNFYEWADAGYIDLTRVRGSMHLSKNLLARLMFGFDEQKLYLRLDPSDELLAFGSELQVQVQIAGRVERQIRFPLRFGARAATRYQIWAPDSGEDWRSIGEHHELGMQEIIELALPISFLQIAAGDPLSFVVRIMKGSVEEDRFPKNGRINLKVPDRNYDSINWSV